MKYRTLAARFVDHEGPLAADIAWSWIADEQERGAARVDKDIAHIDEGLGRGHNYRLHDAAHPTKPPKDSTSDKGRAAVQADLMVQKGIALATYLVGRFPGMGFYMENPVGSLARRDYMRQRVRSGGVVQQEVRCCAYGRHPAL